MSRDDHAQKSDLIDLSLMVHHVTEKAVLLSDTGEVSKAKWCPLSQVENNGDGTWTMPEWLAKEKGFI